MVIGPFAPLIWALDNVDIYGFTKMQHITKFYMSELSRELVQIVSLFTSHANIQDC